MFLRDFYEIIHVIGLAMFFMSMGGIAIHAANGGSKTNTSTRWFVGGLFTGGAFLILLGGFGMMARLNLVRGVPPNWLIGKMVIWLLLGTFGMLPYRKPQLAKPFAIGLPLLAGVAVWMAVYKPL